MNCPICNEGELRLDKNRFVYHNIDFGDFDVEVCDNCRESYLTEKSSKEIEDIAKQLGVWGSKAIPQKLDSTASTDSILIPIFQLFYKPIIPPKENIPSAFVT